jgi:hypothetical protein
MKPIISLLSLTILLAVCGGCGGNRNSGAQAQTIPTQTGSTKTIIGLNQFCNTTSGSGIAYTVPNGQTFILTDYSVQNGGFGGVSGQLIKQIGSESNLLLSISSAGATGDHFVSGYDFPPGSQIVWSTPGNPTQPTCIQISGYLIASQ